MCRLSHGSRRTVDEVLAAQQIDIDPAWQSIDRTTNRAARHAVVASGCALLWLRISRTGVAPTSVEVIVAVEVIGPVIVAVHV
jgi:hypothetical protein